MEKNKGARARIGSGGSTSLGWAGWQEREREGRCSLLPTTTSREGRGCTSTSTVVVAVGLAALNIIEEEEDR